MTHTVRRKPRPQGQAGERCCHFVWFRRADEPTLRVLCTDAGGRSHGLSIPPPLIRPELINGVKRRLAGQISVSAVYAEVKDPACDLIMAAAEAWAGASGWEAGASDA